MGIESFIQKFELGSLREEEFHHPEHLLMALWYFENYSELEAIVRIKAGILKYNLLYGVPQGNDRGYHETITMLFIRLVQRFRKEVDPTASFEEKSEQLLARYSNFRETVQTYYSRERIRSEEARKVWLEPDLEAL